MMMRGAVRRAAAFTQWPVQLEKGGHGGQRCMGYVVRTQGWALIQWAADKRDDLHHLNNNHSSTRCPLANRRQYDLFRVARNASRRGLLHEVPARGRHPNVVRSLRRRLKGIGVGR